jgi:glycosyltransferase involved in cell wall biosynthesis
VPKTLEILSILTKVKLSEEISALDSVIYDRAVAMMSRTEEVLYGWAHMSLASGLAAKKRGAHYVLDRACPHVDLQQAVLRSESEKAGVPFKGQPKWFRDRQIAEYDNADYIVVPSDYSRRSFPAKYQHKIVKAPISGRIRWPEEATISNHAEFTVGVMGGSPLRKGYLYLLQAWEKLALPNAKLLIRSGDLLEYPELKALINRQSNIEFVGYVPNLSDFYGRCDAFVLPSVDDGFGMALFEAMAHGVPCVATKNCGSSELLVSGTDGLVIEPFSAEQLAEAILSLYHAEELRRTIGKNGRQKSFTYRCENSPIYTESIGRLFDALESGSEQSGLKGNVKI